MIYPFFQRINKSRDFSFEGKAGIKCKYIDKELDAKKIDIVFPCKGEGENIELQALVMKNADNVGSSHPHHTGGELYK